ncbi:GTPase HflX [Bacillus sp. CGMCC 1.16541]|uniref:GTPase HflX n=1 Tax=Bacillus sp. CGMCC 1.16541 TaxID=2185143 RepID=UPI000D739F94|nr:GTPase HflX [Bacillus sp. CGMCC 1.16541]
MIEERQRAILVGVQLDKQSGFEYSMEELANLADARDIDVVGHITQNLDRLNKATYVGKGKVEEIRALLAETDADLIICNDELAPSHLRNLGDELDTTVMDRTTLILDIFATRAKTKEAQLQVEVAKLKYQLPRLAGLHESLGRQGGGAGVSNKGAGETKLELNRRRVEDRITALNLELETFVAKREVQRKQRKKNDVPVVSLVGYTNAGKSTIMNAFVDMFHPQEDKQVFEKDMLFATLETSVRNITLPDQKSFLLTDTVGFVDKLPHHLVKAFRSTLEEAREADVLIHVVDYSNPHYEQLIDITNNTLKQMGIEDVPMIYAYNKVDLVDEQEPKVENAVYLSAKKKMGMDQLLDAIASYIFDDYVECQMLIPYDKGYVTSYLNEKATIFETSYEENGTLLTLECRKKDFDTYQAFVIENE